ncbi:MAG: DNA primase, partial [Candidatus Thioglobus sp.]|nr:DNA primase [Candidatus Thioglobus sp.]MBT7002113.1 DNA primase [Candidatus Thioglobus sp.]MBT7412445.1 DNA primase [Candidatus Thioglobus sp.]
MPFINNDFINDLSNQVDIVDLINRRVPLKKAGKDYKACCPFHNEKTPSFTVVADKQYYHCFGCGENGNAIDFVMKFDHLNFIEAVEVVAGESGVSVVYDQNARPVDPKMKRYRDLMQEVSEFYQSQ